MQQTPHPLYGITVSTNYADILNIVIHQNQQFFTKWYIVTAETDSQTIETIRSANYTNIEILYFDFHKGGYKFNKGGAVRYAQQTILANHNEGVNTLIVDSDIFIPDEFGDYYNKNSHLLQPNTLYGVEQRFDYSKYSDFKKKINGIYYTLSKGFFGFFQLYKQAADKLYIDSIDCGCESHFINLFTIQNTLYLHSLSTNNELYEALAKVFFPRNNCIYIPITVSHLGAPNMHWTGRIKKDDFIVDCADPISA